MVLTIERAGEEDKAPVLAIVQTVIREGKTYPYDPALTPEQIETVWFAPAHQVFAAKEEDRILGTYYLKPNQPGLGDHIANAGFMVAPNAAGRGIGRTMLEDALARAKETGYRAMQFNYVVATNHGSLKMCRAAGFRELGRVPQAFRHPDHGLTDALILYRELT